MMTTIHFKVPPVLLSLFCVVSSITAFADNVPGWEKKHLQLQQQRDEVFIQLESIHSSLVPLARDEAPSLLTRLSIEPPKARVTGYGLLPVIEENEPPANVAPKQTFYSLKWLEERLFAELQNANDLYAQLTGEKGLEYLVTRFEETLKRLRNLEDNLTYHAKWQKAVVRHPAYFQNKNKLVAMARELNTLIVDDASPLQVAQMRNELLMRVAPFKPGRNLQITTGKGDERVLPVSVCTDIADSDFLKAFQDGVDEAFSLSDTAQAKQFSIDLSWQRVRAENLYPEGVPVRGANIDMEAHHALFTGCAFVLTTGATSLNARVGSRIFLGTEPVSPRTLAHEFGHLLGFEDAYVRGYDGDPSDPYGVVIVEWTGLSSDLMGDSARGQVSDEMIDTLIRAYSGPMSTH